MAEHRAPLDLFRECLKSNVEELLKVGVGLEKEIEAIRQVEVEELPEMLRIDVETFYQGFVRRPDLESYPDIKRVKDKKITMNQIFEEDPTTKPANYVMIVGPAGSGKTTILTRFARDAINGKIPQIDAADSMVHIVNCRQFDAGDKITVRDLLFRHMIHKPSDEAIEEGFQWMLSHPDKVILIVDSLDTLPFPMEDFSLITSNEELLSSNCPSAILYNVLSGKICKWRVLSSSREHAIGEYTGDLRAERIIKLQGFSSESMRKVIFSYLSNTDGEKLLESYRTECPQLLELCKTPVFLIFTIIGYARYMQYREFPGFIPKTMTGVMINLLQTMVSSKENAPAFSSQSRWETTEILEKLKQFSFWGMYNDKVIFQKSDLDRVDLDVKDVSDLIIVTPGRIRTGQNILQGETILFFMHQCVQEILCALYVADMTLEDFSKNFETVFNKPIFAVVKKMVIGLLLDPEVNEEASEDLMKAQDYEDKAMMTREQIKSELREAEDIYKLQQLTYAVYEAGAAEDIVPEEYHGITLQRTPLKESDTHALACLLSKSRHVKRVELGNCSLAPNSVRALVTGLEKCENLQIDMLGIGENKELETSGIEMFGKFVDKFRVKEIDLENCNLNGKLLEAFSNVLVHTKISKLDVHFNSTMEVAGLEALGELVKKCEIQHLNISHCDLVEAAIAAFSEKLGKTKMTGINISWNENMSDKSLHYVGEIVKRCEVRQLDLSGCKLTSNHMKDFSETVEDAKIDQLKICYNTQMGADGAAVLGSLVKRCQIDNLDMSNCELTPDQVPAFSTAMAGAKIRILSMGNDEIPLSPPDVFKLFPYVTEQLNIDGRCVDEDRMQYELNNLYPTKLKVRCHGRYGVLYTISSKDPNYKGGKLEKSMLSKKSPEPEKKPAEEGPQVMQVDDQATAETRAAETDLQSIRKRKKDSVSPRKSKKPLSQDSEVEEATGSQLESREPIKYSKIIEKEIDENGGDIEIGGCFIHFPKKAFDEAVSVKVKAEIDGAKCPRGFVQITPMIYVEADKPLRVPANVLLTSWCMNDGSSQESKSTKVHVLHKSDNSGEWEKITTLPLLDKTIFQFDCTDFSPVVVGVEEPQAEPQFFLLDPYLFADERGNFTLAFCLRSQLSETHIIGRMRNRQPASGLKLHFNVISAKMNQTITATVAPIRPHGFEFLPNGPFRFVVDDQFIRQQQVVTFDFTLFDNNNLESTRVIIDGSLMLNNAFVDQHRMYGYDYSRDPVTPAPPRVENLNLIQHADSVTLSQVDQPHPEN